MVRKGFLVLCLMIIFSSSFVVAFSFNGTTLDQTGTALNNTLVNVSMYNTTNDYSYVGSNWTYTNASGWFNLNLTDNVFWEYAPVIRYENNSVITHVGQTIPSFPSQVLTDIAGITFYLQEAGTIYLSAVNESGSNVAFQYQIKDQKLGFTVADSFANAVEVTNITVYLPRDRNYSLMIYPNQAMPTSFDWSNFSSNASYTFGHGSSQYNASTFTLNKTFNLTSSHARVSGYFHVPRISGWDDFGVIAYLLEPGSMAHAVYGAMPANMSGLFDGTTDYVNLSSGVENYSGFYNISLPSTVETSEMLLFAVARNGTSYWGGFHNLSLDYNLYQNGSSFPLNFSSTFGLLGEEANITVYPFFGSPTNISTRLQSFNLVDTNNTTLSGVSAHAEVDLDYSAYGVKPFTWMSGSGQSSQASFSVPLLNITGIEEMNVFASGNYEPVRADYTVSEITQNNNLTVSTFNPGDIEGTLNASSIFVSFYLSNTTCDVPRPTSPCVISDSTSVDQFNPIAAVFGGGKISFRMGLPSSGIEVHYVNVDLIASGPPSALFDDSASTSTDDTFDSALRFGSNGPTIYDYVLVSMPYTKGDDSTSGLNDSAPVNLSIPLFYDEDWNVIWNASVNGTNATQLGANLSHYEAKSSEWQILMTNSTCVTDVSAFNVTSPCFINTTSSKVWVRIPHFSGTGLSLVGSVVTASSVSSGLSGSGGGSGPSASLEEGVLRMQLNTPYSFVINNEEHLLYVRDIDRDQKAARFELPKQETIFILDEGQEKAFDLTGDVVADIVFSLERVYDNLNLVEVAVSYPSGELVDVSDNEVTSDSFLEDESFDLLDDQSSALLSPTILWWSFILIIFVALVIVVILKEHKKTGFGVSKEALNVKVSP